MGRRKIEIKPIRDDRNRSVTFLKRKGGLFKKAHELSVLCSVDVAVIIFGHNKKLYEYSSSDINETIGRFQYYGGAHEHKGPQDFADKGGGDDDDDEDNADEGDERGGTPAPDHPMMGMQHHPGFQHVRHGTPQGSPPMHNGNTMPQFQRGPSPLPPGASRPSSRQSQHPGHRRTSSNLVPQQHPHPPGGPMPPQPNYAYTPNPPFYNPQAAAQAQQRPPGPPVPMSQPPPPNATYPPPYPPQHPQMQQMMMQDDRRQSMPPSYPPPQQHAPPANMQRGPTQDRLQPPPHGQPHSSPRLQQQQPGQPTPSPQPQQNQFASPPIPQPKAMPAHQKSHSIFTPIDDSRSMLAAAWGSTSNVDHSRIDPAIKADPEGPRSQSIDVAVVQREKEASSLRPNGVSPRPSPGRAPRPPAQAAIQRTESVPAVPQVRAPQRTNTMQSDAKRPRLKVQIPSEQSGDEAGTADDAPDDSNTSNPANSGGHPQQHMPAHGVVLPPPSPSAGALLSAGAQGPPNPFARPAPPMSTNPHAVNREAPTSQNNIETPISALPSRFMSDNLLPSPSTFYPEWGFGRSGDSNMLPSPLNFQTPVVANGVGWSRSEDDRKRGNEEEGGGGESKKQRT